MATNQSYLEPRFPLSSAATPFLSLTEDKGASRGKHRAKDLAITLLYHLLFPRKVVISAKESAF